jgi:hypothetical protein
VKEIGKDTVPFTVITEGDVLPHVSTEGKFAKWNPLSNHIIVVFGGRLTPEGKVGKWASLASVVLFVTLTVKKSMPS